MRTHGYRESSQLPTGHSFNAATGPRPHPAPGGLPPTFSTARAPALHPSAAASSASAPHEQCGQERPREGVTRAGGVVGHGGSRRNP